MKACQLSSVWKIFEKEFFYSLMRIIPARTQSQDKKFQTSRPCEVRRSVQVTTFVVSSFFTLSLQAVVLLTKIAINHRFFSVKSGFKKFQRL